jgi:hypothetical protein
MMTEDDKRHTAALGPINVGSKERMPSLLVGGLLALLGLSRGSLRGLLLAAIGGILVYRGATGHCPVYQTLGMDTSDYELASYDRTGANAVDPEMVGVKPPNEDNVEEASWESFPASDAPSWTGNSIT